MLENAMDWKKLVEKPKGYIEMVQYKGNPEWILSNDGHNKLDERIKALLEAYKAKQIKETDVILDIGQIVACMEQQGAAGVAQYLCTPIKDLISRR